MTITSTVNRKEYTGNGATTDFAFPYYVLDEDDLQVYLDGVLQTIVTHYTLSLTPPQTAGVDVQFVTAPPDTESVVILRDPPITQSVDLIENDSLPAEEVEKAIDRLTMICQRLDAQVDRSFTLPDTDVSGTSVVIPTPVAGKFLGWSGDGLSLENLDAPVTLPSGVAVSSFMETVLDDLTGAAALATLGAITEADDLTFIGDINFSGSIAFTGVLSGLTPIIFEGAVADGFETSIALTEPTADRTISIPDADVDLADIGVAATTSVAGISELGTGAEVKATSPSTTLVPSIDALRTGLVWESAYTSVGTGTSVQITGVPSWAKVVEILLRNVSPDGVANVYGRLGTSGGMATSGYIGGGSLIETTSVNSGTITTAMVIRTDLATHSVSGIISCRKIDGDIWIMAGHGSAGNLATTWNSGAEITLAGTLDRVGLAMSGGNFDDGDFKVIAWG